jgi:hypothetical protein
MLQKSGKKSGSEQEPGPSVPPASDSSEDDDVPLSERRMEHNMGDNENGEGQGEGRGGDGDGPLNPVQQIHAAHQYETEERLEGVKPQLTTTDIPEFQESCKVDEPILISPGTDLSFIYSFILTLPPLDMDNDPKQKISASSIVTPPPVDVNNGDRKGYQDHTANDFDQYQDDDNDICGSSSIIAYDPPERCTYTFDFRNEIIMILSFGQPPTSLATFLYQPH